MFFVHNFNCQSPVLSCKHCWKPSPLRSIVGWPLEGSEMSYLKDSRLSRGIDCSLRSERCRVGLWKVPETSAQFVHSYFNHIHISILLVHLLFVCFSVSPLVITWFAMEARSAQFSHRVLEECGVFGFKIKASQCSRGVLKYFEVVQTLEALSDFGGLVNRCIVAISPLYSFLILHWLNTEYFFFSFVHYNWVPDIPTRNWKAT